MRKNLFISLALAVALLLPHPGVAAASDKVYEFSYQSLFPGAPHVLNRVLYKEWIEEVKKRSNNRLIINFFLSGAIVSRGEATPALINGVLDIAGVSAADNDTLFPNSLPFTIPHIARDVIHGQRNNWKAYTTIPEIKAEWDDRMKVLAVWASDRGALFSIKGPILTPADLAGKRVLVTSGGHVDQVNAWGGAPVRVTANDVYMSLQRGMGDVFFGNLPMITSLKLMEVAKDVTIFPANTNFQVIGMNWDAWNELPPDLQKILEDTTGEAFSRAAAELLYEHANADLAVAKAAGVTIHNLTDAQYQAFLTLEREPVLNAWIRNLKRLGNPDPEAAIARAFKMSEGTLAEILAEQRQGKP